MHSGYIMPDISHSRILGTKLHPNNCLIISEMAEYDPKPQHTVPTIIIVVQSATCRNIEKKMLSRIGGNHNYQTSSARK